MKSGKYYIFCISLIKSPKRFGIEQLFLKYKYENDIHEHGKQQDQ